MQLNELSFIGQLMSLNEGFRSFIQAIHDDCANSATSINTFKEEYLQRANLLLDRYTRMWTNAEMFAKQGDSSEISNTDNTVVDNELNNTELSDLIQSIVVSILKAQHSRSTIG